MVEVNFEPGIGDPEIKFIILVTDQLFIKQTYSGKDLFFVSAKGHRIHKTAFIACPEMRVANAKGRGHGGTDHARGFIFIYIFQYATCTHDHGIYLKRLYAFQYKVLIQLRMRSQDDDDLRCRGADAKVQGEGRGFLEVIQQVELRIGFYKFPDQLPRTIVAHPIVYIGGEQLCRVRLRYNGLQTTENIVFLIEAGNNYGNSFQSGF